MTSSPNQSDIKTNRPGRENPQPMTSLLALWPITSIVC